MVKQAIDTVSTICDGLGRNQACYGNTEIIALNWENTALFGFETPGDRT